MRIAYHHRTRATDAQKIHITEIIKAFRELGHEVEVVSLVETEDAPQDAAREARQAGWQTLVRRIPFAYELVQLGYNALGIPLLFWRLWRFKPDFIYERYSLFNFSGVVVAALLRRPIVLEVNSPFALEQGRDREIRAVRFAAWMERVICNAADRVVVVTGALKRILISNGVKNAKLVVMSNGVNRRRFQQQPSAPALRARMGLHGKTVIGFVGWFRNWHGLDLLIEGFHQSGLGRQNVALLLIGDGPAMKDVRDMVAQLALGDSVILTGALPHESVPEHLDLIDIAVQPAANEYCCPMKIIEYMALGKPVVAPRQENIEELVRDGVDAVLFTPGEARALGSALTELVNDHGRAVEMGNRARRAIEERGFLWEHNANRVVELVSAERRRSTSAQAGMIQRKEKV
jgi:glycosyltransferase involved in cell wall biosynthesis